ncbi:MAG TPA: tetratricopeptide repeat protein [Candidatus Ozemobacteraceae bacterium]|nr:tetratricopeptide repeat protein [Candidatus Ozemobacteraceae bacterium]
MSTETRFRMSDGRPAIVFRPDGGAMTWQDWMCQPVALLAEAPGNPDRVVLLSFQSGMPLASVSVSPECRTALNSAKAHVLASGDVPESQDADAAVVKLEPFDASGFLHEGIKKQMRGELEAAVEAYGRAEAEVPELPRAANLRGLCLRLLGRNEEAEAAYRRELETSPAMPDAFANLGILFARSGRNAEARAMFEKALERDQFYLNALLHFARLLAAEGQKTSRLFASLNMRLLGAWADAPQAQEHLLAMASACGASPAEFAALLRAEAGWLADPFVLQTMKRCEILRLNGAYIATLRGYGVLLDRTAGMPSAAFFRNWVARRNSLIETMIGDIYIQEWNSLKAELQARHPELAPASPAPAADAGRDGQPERDGAMSPEEFYSIIVTEMLRDGQVSQHEAALLNRFRAALRISDQAHARILDEAVAATPRSPMTDGGGEFRSEAFLRRLAAAVIRDGKIDELERKMVVLAAQTLNVSSDAVKAAFREVAA